MRIKNHIHGMALWAMALGLTACNSELADLLGGNDSNAISFECYHKEANTANTRGGEAVSDYAILPGIYSPLTISMYENEETEASATARYTVTTSESTDWWSDNTDKYESDAPLHWPGNGPAIGFSASAGDKTFLYVESTLTADQRTEALQVKADRIEGVAALGSDSKTEMARHRAPDWKSGLSAADAPVIPLYLHHKKALITVRLAAGEGVSTDVLKYVKDNPTLSDTIFSYVADDESHKRVAVLPYATEGTLDDGTETTVYQAIVEPYDYRETGSNRPITRVNLNGQKFTYYASLDTRHEPEVYDLKEGDHLDLTITLGRGGRVISVLAQKKNWQLELEREYNANDFGHAQDPIIINNAEQWQAFVNNDDEDHNSPLGMAILNADNLNLTDVETGSAVLRATINLGGNTIRVSNALFRQIEESGQLKNGYISVESDGHIAAAVTTVNDGTLKNITVNTTGKVTANAGLAQTNTDKGRILQCVNNMPVAHENSASTDALGGIAAVSGGLIENCVNNAKVSPLSNVAAGGIVGKATGTAGTVAVVRNNEFTYGKTIKQTTLTAYNNIIGSGENVQADGNKWPTVAREFVGGIETINNYLNEDETQYSGVFDSADELADLVRDGGQNNKSYRLAADIKLPADWLTQISTLSFLLDGNDKRITTSRCIFRSVKNTLRNLEVYVDGDVTRYWDPSLENYRTMPDGVAVVALKMEGDAKIVGVELDGEKTGTAADAPMKYCVKGNNVGGLVLEALNGTIEDCVNRVPVVSLKQHDNIYAGGIVAEVGEEHSENQLVKVVNCVNTPTASVTYDPEHTAITQLFSGGIVGGCKSEGIVIIQNCSSFAEVTAPHCAGGVIGKWWVEGRDGIKRPDTDEDKSVGNWWNETVVKTATGDDSRGNTNLTTRNNAVTPMSPANKRP